MDFRRLRPGTRLGPYTIVDGVGRGAFASVYQGEDDHGVRRALKVRHSGEPGLDRRFLREFESMRSLRVPGVVRVHDAGAEGELLWFAMDLVDGVPFDTFVQRSPPAERATLAARVGAQLLETLAGLHGAGAIHRDVKPSNVLVDASNRVHLLDLGIVRFFGDAERQHTTRTGELVGTLPFMAPEQLAGAPFDERIDVWAAGILLYESIGGKRERPKNTVAWIPKTCLERPVPLAVRIPDLPLALSDVIARMLNVDPEDRPTAAQAAAALRAVLDGTARPEWPEPTFVDVGAVDGLIGCVGDRSHPALGVVVGRAGSGRRRLTEQLQREGLVRGVWTLHTRCDPCRVGAPITALLERLARVARDDLAVAGALEGPIDPLRRRWPGVGLPGSPSTPVRVDDDAVAAALAGLLTRLAARRPVLWVVHEAESVDPLTARLLPLVARQVGASVGLVVTFEGRWSTARAEALAQALVERGAAEVSLDRMSEAESRAIAKNLAPDADFARVTSCRPQNAVEAGLAALAARRGLTFHLPSPRLWPLVLGVSALPVEVVRKLCGSSTLEDPAARVDGGQVSLVSDTVAAAIRARLGDRQQAAGSLLMAWRALARVPDADLARLRLLAGQDHQAFGPAARSAVEAEHLGRYADARRWLDLLDTLPLPEKLSSEAQFELARVRARVSLRTSLEPPTPELADAVAQLARDPAQELDARLVAAEVQLRLGEVKNAVVAALRVASGAQEAAPRVAVRALLVATQARASAGRLDEVSGELDRAEALLRAHPDPVLAVQALSWRGELATWQQELAIARDLSEEALRDADRFGYVRGAAFAAARLGRLYRMAGRRRAAEAHTRDALDRFVVTGDVALHVEARLLLATLLAERGDAPIARHVLDDALRRIRTLNLTRLTPLAMRAVLGVATLKGDVQDAEMALAALSPDDEEAPAAVVRWWRTRGDVDRALAVPRPRRDGYGAVAFAVERARALLDRGDPQAARAEATRARDAAVAAGFAELALLAALVAGATGVPDLAWDQRLAEAADGVHLDVVLGAIEMDGRRRAARGDVAGARSRFENLALRASELGHGPAAEEAAGWLARLPEAPRPGTSDR
jgi:tetratricopeptide (TPR) repeat protein